MGASKRDKKWGEGVRGCGPWGPERSHCHKLIEARILFFDLNLNDCFIDLVDRFTD